MAGATMVRRLELRVHADDGDTALKLDRITEKAERLKEAHPDLAVRIDTAAASEKLRVLRGELRDTSAAADKAPIDVRVASAEAKAKLDAIKANAEELRKLNPTLVPRIDDAEASAKLAVLRGELTATEEKSAGLGRAWEVTKYALLGLGGALGYGVYKAMGFDAAMTRVHTLAGVSVPTMKTLSAGVLQLAGQVGQGPDSLAEAMYHVASNMASMGAKAPQMLGAVKIAAEGASVGGANLVDVTNALGAAIASGIPGVKNYQSAMGALNATVGAGDMTMQDLAEAMGTGFLSNVKIYGSTLNDVGAILATFGDNNIRGAHAGTQLRMSVQSIAVQAKTAGPYLKELGLQVGELGKYQSLHGTVATINLLVDRLKASGVATNEWGNIITQLFGKKAGAGIAVLIDQYERLDSKQKVLTAGAKGFGAEWAATQNTAQQRLKDLEYGAEALAISLGEKLLPAATKILGWLSDFVNGLEHGSAAASTIAAVIGTVLAGIALKKLEEGIRGAVDGFETLGKGAWAAIKWTGQFAASAGRMAMQWASAVASMTRQAAVWVATNTAKVAVVVAENIAAAVTTAAAWVAANATMLLGVGGLVAGIGIAVYEIATHWRQITAWTARVWKEAWREITHAFDEARHGIAVGFNFIRHAASEAFGWVKAHWPLLLGIMTGPIGVAAALIGTHWHQITAGAARMFRDVVGFFAAMPGNILRGLGDLGHLLWNAGQAIIQGLINGMESLVGNLLSAAGNIAGNLISSIGHALGIGSPSKIAYWHGQMFGQGLINGLDSMNTPVGLAAGRMAAGMARATAIGAAGHPAPGGAYGGHLIVEFRGLSPAMRTMLKKSIRITGGNVQVIGL